MEIWEHFVKLLPLEEYLVMDTFIQGILKGIQYNMLKTTCRGLAESDIGRYKFELCKLDLRHLSEIQVADKIVGMSKLKFGLKIKSMGKKFFLYSDYVLIFIFQVTVIQLSK